MIGEKVVYVNCYDNNLDVGDSIELGSTSYTVDALAQPASQDGRRLNDGLPIFLDQEVSEVVNSGESVPVEQDDDDSSNLGLILGLSIGLGVPVLLIVLYICVVY